MSHQFYLSGCCVAPFGSWQLLAVPVSGGTCETRLECQWAAAAGRATWSHHSHTRSAILAHSAVDQFKKKVERTPTSSCATCASSPSLRFCTNVDNFCCGPRLIDPLPVQTGNVSLSESACLAVMSSVCVCVCVVGGEAQQTRYLLITACGMQPTALRRGPGPASLFVQGVIRVAVTHLWETRRAQVDS